MAPERTNFSSREFPMASVASPFSYRTNSVYQRRVVRATKQLMHAVVMEKLQVENGSIFQITDISDQTHSFHLMINFNTLFASDKPYYAHAAIGSFYDGVFPDNQQFICTRSGLVFITVPARPNGIPHSKVIYNMLADILGSCFLHLVKQVRIVTRRGNGSFSIEKLEILSKETMGSLTAKDASVHIRAITEEKFGPKILDKLFQLHEQKLEDAYLDLISGEAISLFIALKRKPN
ncbi:hypothetical protein R3W88_030504 [Solanum pinnatisectum]|uniref:rRNA N-glycosidase n=1 Tax=Solanum pinnatisectum TaxID=50273 RepID=A0AAV9KAD9_9SOLN|nr:hypothetical protein R3W88_030504 [Solanum pinnatisectum]